VRPKMQSFSFKEIVKHDHKFMIYTIHLHLRKLWISIINFLNRKCRMTTNWAIKFFKK
jgi:hypothetical protein